MWEIHKQAEEPQLWSAAKDPVIPFHLQNGSGWISLAVTEPAK